jgi:manganese-dependent inorganic pyrophosphatase
MKTYIIGHQKPDLDSVVAAMSIAEYLKFLGVQTVQPAIIDNINEETRFVFDKFQVPPPELITLDSITPEDKIVLVDHNEADQRLVGLNQDQIISIFDHHKVNINFSSPISVCILPYGSSNTVIWELMKNKNITIDPKLASLMLSAVLSDTVGLKSSTTTETDKLAVADLHKISGVLSIENLTLEIFTAKSNIAALTDEQIVLNDYKIYDFGGKKVLIGQTETVEQSEIILVKKDKLLIAMEQIKKREGMDLIFLALTDILKVNTKLLILGDAEKTVAEKAFNATTSANILDIGPRMSRKKDIAPQIENILISSTNQ